MQEVFFMHEYPIEGVQDGTLRAEKDGLYWKIDASCTRDPSVIDQKQLDELNLIVEVKE